VKSDFFTEIGDNPCPGPVKDPVRNENDHGNGHPGALAPIQVVVMAIKDEVIEAVHRIGAELRTAGIRVRIDDRADVQFGRRAIDWELKGVPLRVEVGPRDLAAGSVMLARRLTGGPKTVTALTDLVDQILLLPTREQEVMLHPGDSHSRCPHR